MSYSASGYSRPRELDNQVQGLPYGDDKPSASISVRKDKPRDWRDAFLEEPEIKDGRDRNRERDNRKPTREDSFKRDRAGISGRSDGKYDRPPKGDETEEGEIPERPSSRRRTRSPTPPRSRPYGDQPASRGGYDQTYRGRGGRGGAGSGGYPGNSRGGYHNARGGHNQYQQQQPSNSQYSSQRSASSSARHNSTSTPPSAPKAPSPPPKKAEEIIEEIPDIVELNPEEALAERRRKRQEIMARFSETPNATPPPVAVTPALKSVMIESTSNASTPGGVTPSTPFDLSFSLEKDASSEAIPHSSANGTFQSTPSAEEEISAADYDPSADRRAEDIRRLQNETAAKEARNMITEAERTAQEAAQKEIDEVGASPDEDSDDDMFSGVIKPKEVVKKTQLEVPVITSILPSSAATLSDNWDDADGYYRIIPGEVIDDGRYHVFTTLGKGMFSAVVRARVVKPGPGEQVGKEVAIKIVRSQESMFKAGLKEIQILNKLRDADMEDKKHIIRLERTFEHRGHLCMVFENLSMNLRDVIKRFGKDVGLNMRAVKAYAHQMFLALSLLKKCSIMHADIKPDNILVTENKSLLKICDLGSASDESENEVTPYLVSRFYRAPEIILGLPYDCSLDIWSIGCTLFELYTGKILFPGRTNNQMLHHMMELKGKFNVRAIKKSQFRDMHFDENMNFISVEVDKITGQNVTKILPFTKPSRDLRARLLPSTAAQQKMKDDELKNLLSFIDLLDKCLTLDSSKRITPREALQHPFLRS
ncbi:kinase-like protein [Phaffia rhodozyma]|uniref:non-specific serine/threonine protein kinase n=1 Tax=Phaffia rhodozyma TaxID=264483 RepID=A0A0F7SG22_PHARH|nr:kinase-like protein [Phaffia rhodozyma]